MSDVDTEMGLTQEEFFAWLGEHDVDYRQVKHIEFTAEGVNSASPGRVCMKVTRYRLNAEGKRFFDPTDAVDPDHVAWEMVWVPIKNLPGR